MELTSLQVSSPGADNTNPNLQTPLMRPVNRVAQISIDSRDLVSIKPIWKRQCLCFSLLATTALSITNLALAIIELQENENQYKDLCQIQPMDSKCDSLRISCGGLNLIAGTSVLKILAESFYTCYHCRTCNGCLPRAFIIFSTFSMGFALSFSSLLMINRIFASTVILSTLAGAATIAFSLKQLHEMKKGTTITFC